MAWKPLRLEQAAVSRARRSMVCAEAEWAATLAGEAGDTATPRKTSQTMASEEDHRAEEAAEREAFLRCG